MNKVANILAKDERDHLVLTHLHLCHRGARRFARNATFEYEDAQQVGALELVRSAELFDPTRGVPFEAYAWMRIVGALMHYVRDHENIVRIPRTLRAQGVQRIDIAGVVDDAHDNPEAKGAVALHACDDGFAHVDDAVTVRSLLDRLDARSRSIVEAYYFNRSTQSDVGRVLDLSQRQVGRILARSVRYLRADAA